MTSGWSKTGVVHCRGDTVGSEDVPGEVVCSKLSCWSLG
jgi:hypothetical protein